LARLALTATGPRSAPSATWPWPRDALWTVVPRVLRWTAGVLTLLVVAMGASMLGRGQHHYPSDTIGAAVVALTVALLVALIVEAGGR
jgi:hypothetical protein